ncbi:hypothetical protein PMZ80_002696 [Knufia obscura]|uniref:Uncharacterized protein n=1 Tax=Knufia obscura TaxID=1635080 RepID=A0ABR0RY27_9EURO|nr:hypothetical protein PMZ80_002696 [Knufia obscura]
MNHPGPLTDGPTRMLGAQKLLIFRDNSDNAQRAKATNEYEEVELSSKIWLLEKVIEHHDSKSSHFRLVGQGNGRQPNGEARGTRCGPSQAGKSGNWSWPLSVPGSSSALAPSLTWGVPSWADGNARKWYIVARYFSTRRR